MKRKIVLLVVLSGILFFGLYKSTGGVVITPESQMATTTRPNPAVPKEVGDKKTSEVALVTVTAYSAVESCHYEGCVMASGKKAYVGAVACPRYLKLGTKVMLGDKVYTCEDRTAVRYDGRFDIFFGYEQADYQRALRFGIQRMNFQLVN